MVGGLLAVNGSLNKEKKLGFGKLGMFMVGVAVGGVRDRGFDGNRQRMLHHTDFESAIDL